MNKLYIFAVAVALTATAAATLPITGRQVPLPRWTGDANGQLDAPFRDGLYLGSMAAKNGRAPHIASGRWASDRDRAAFAAGYRRGYAQTIAASDPCRLSSAL